MGRVYRAFQKGIDRDVAVKILHRELSANAQLVARFHREAKVASRMLHPNVVQVHLVGQLPDGSLYIVMEFLDGLSLQSALAAAGGALPLPRALHIGLQICDAVGEAHAQGVVHRDLKPENVMLVHRGQDADFVKVLDFGIARVDSGEQSMSTAAGLIFGTARYISPEGAQGEQVGAPGDVYAIATLIYQMLAGRTPFDGDQAVALLLNQIHDAPPPLKSIARAAYVPDSIANLLMANLAKDKSKRAPDARTLGRQLMDAAKAAGLSPEDLMPRSVHLGGGGRAGAVRLASMQRTGQLQLDRPITEIAPSEELPFARPGAGPPAGMPPVGPSSALAALPTKTAYVTPVDPMSLPPQMATVGLASRIAPAPPPATPVSMATQKWVPPASVQAQMAAGVPPAPISSVDLTMDEANAQLSPAMPPASTRQLQPTEPRSAESRPQLPRSGVAPTAFDEGADDPAPPAEAPKGKIALIVALVAVVSLGVTVGAYRARVGGAESSREAVDAAVARAEDALKRERFDNPPGDNVRDLTNDALLRWPREPRVLAVRSSASSAIVQEARQHQAQGDLLGAQKLAKLATELDPASGAAHDLAAQFDALAQANLAPVPPAPAWPDAGTFAAAAPMVAAPAKMPPTTGSAHKPVATQPPAPAPAALAPAPAPAAPRAAAATKAAPPPAPSASVKWL
jgi:serine/threonine-protein kinase